MRRRGRKILPFANNEGVTLFSGGKKKKKKKKDVKTSYET